MEIINTTALISINETSIAQLVSFLIFLFIMNRIMFRPLRDTMEKRSNFIKGLTQDISDAEDEFDNLSSQLKIKKRNVRAEALKIANELDESAKKQAKEINDATRLKSKTLLKSTENQIIKQIDKARVSLHQEAEAIMTGIMEKVLNRRLV